MRDSEISITFQAAPRSLRRRGLREFARRLSDTVAGGRGFACLIAGDAELTRLNREFRARDYPADVLSFRSGMEEGTLGDIAISVERAADQARELGHTLDEEVRILLLHGVLHLAGMDHESDAGEMRRAERKYRREFGLPEGLIESVSR